MDKNDKTAQPSGTLNLDKLQAICDAATPGPWFSQAVVGYRSNLFDVRAQYQRPVAGSIHDPTDATFIAAAREALPALIAQARAAQPESTTLASQEETTGASIKTWQERVSEDHSLVIRTAMEQEIADLRNEVTNLRSQLTAKGNAMHGQGDDYTVDDSELARKIMVFLGRATTQSMEPGADPLRDRLAAKIALWRPAAPASTTK